jgi:predicted signal transduction protein with EAL and GGDEF domain
MPSINTVTATQACGGPNTPHSALYETLISVLAAVVVKDTDVEPAWVRALKIPVVVAVSLSVRVAMVLMVSAEAVTAKEVTATRRVTSNINLFVAASFIYLSPLFGYGKQASREQKVKHGIH